MLPVAKRNSWLPSVFDDFFNTEFVPHVNRTAPAVNILVHDQEYVVELAVPGLNKNDFKVNIDNDGNLVIKMEKKEETKDNDNKAHYLRREFSYSSFEQTLILPDDVDKEHISAKMLDGVLTVTLPKRAEIVKSLGMQIEVE
ncbi:MAG: Hsp20/alpha crystallin family protein [Prevotella sp.]